MSNLTFKTLTGLILILTLSGLIFPSLANPTALNYISDMKGDVKLKRSQQNSYKKPNVGDLLNPSDQLQLGAGASATVMCNNLKIWVVPTKKVSLVSDGCGSRKPVLTRPNSSRSPSRTPNETIPYIISPRQTFLLTNRPIFRWNAVPGTTIYKVKLQDPSLTLNWKIETNKTQIEYSGNPLQPGTNYSLIVETDQGKSSTKEQGVNLSFTVLDTQKAELIQTKIAQLKQLKLSQDAEDLGLAYLYQSYDLKAEAIELLEALIKRGNQSVAVSQLLGDLYLQVWLSIQAKTSYLRALELAKKTENIEGQAKAQEGLGEAYYGLNNKKEGIMWLKKSKDNYTILGDKLKVEELEKRINSL